MEDLERLEKNKSNYETDPQKKQFMLNELERLKNALERYKSALPDWAGIGMFVFVCLFMFVSFCIHFSFRFVCLYLFVL